MEVEFSVKKNGYYAFGYIVGAVYRQALINIGFSADTHIYELPRERIRKNHLNVSGRYVLRTAAAYDSLNDLEKEIFVNDFLEKGRHYRFWYLSFCNSRTYMRAKKETIKEISHLIKRR